MTKSLRSLVLAFSILLVPGGGCGVHVGNGVKSYSSAEGYSMEYSERLSLRETEYGRRVTVDNSALLPSGQEKPRSEATIIVEGTQMHVRDAESLRQYAYGRGEEGKLIRRDVPGAIGFVYRRVSRGAGPANESMHAKYYFLLAATGKVVRGEVWAYAAGQGLELIAPLLDSFRGR